MQSSKDKGKELVRVVDGDVLHAGYVIRQAVLLVLFVELWIPGGLAVALFYKGTPLVLLAYCLMLILVMGASLDFVRGLSGAERKLWGLWVIWLTVTISMLVRTVVYFKYRGYLTETELHPLFSAIVFMQEQLWTTLMYKLVWCIVNVEVGLFVLSKLHLRLKGSTFKGLIYRFRSIRHNYGVVELSITEALKELLMMVILGAYLALVVVLMVSMSRSWLIGSSVLLIALCSLGCRLGYKQRGLFVPIIKTHHLVLSKVYALIITFHYVLVNVVTWGWNAIKSAPILIYDTKAFSLLINMVCIGYILINLISVTHQMSCVSTLSNE